MFAADVDDHFEVGLDPPMRGLAADAAAVSGEGGI